VALAFVLTSSPVLPVLPPDRARGRFVRVVWAALAYVCFAVGMVGLVVPGLPTTPFVLLAAWAASRGSERLRARILAHPRAGPLVRDWQEHGSVARPAKRAATCVMAASGAVLLLASSHLWLSVAGLLAMLSVLVWIWRRPER
jgi:uncharacterized membrane protein YbaN (DUF454 family)